MTPTAIVIGLALVVLAIPVLAGPILHERRAAGQSDRDRDRPAVRCAAAAGRAA
jgi:hypothetical protein